MISLRAKCDWVLTSINGVYGYLVYGRGKYASESIFLPFAGYGWYSSLSYYGNSGHYWSSVPYSGFDFAASKSLSFSTNSVPLGLDGFAPCYGLTIRPVHNSLSHFVAMDSASFMLDTVNGTRVAREEELLSYSTEWDKGSSVRVIADGATLKEAVAPASGDVVWEGAKASLGLHTFTHVSGGKTLTARFAVLGDEVAVHSGVITVSEIWNTNKVHLVTGAVTVPSGVSLTINPGTVVKFIPGMSLTVVSGGSCTASGAIFTHVNDDTIGGDTLMDKDSTVPKAGEYMINGNILDDSTTEYRYSSPQTLSGDMSNDTRLRGYSTYIVSNSLTVASGAKLTLLPGTILKFNSGSSLTVNGTLESKGTRAAPIIFTSLKDDEYGGDTNADGNKTIPQPGDWVKIGINGGTANFEFTSILYSSKNQTTGAINMNGGTIVFNNSEIAHGMYDAVGVESGHLYMTNSVIRDCLLAFRHWAKDPIVNSVIYDCGRLTQGGGQHFVNCIFSRITETWEAFGFPQNGTTYDNCCFWNEGGSILTAEGKQDAMTVCGKNGNIWGDPLFVDPDNGDFRIKEGSPCMDAADTAIAPSTDYYGQPRVTLTYGVTNVLLLADIGISEVMPRNIASDIDLVPENVTSSTNVAPGQSIVIKWTVRNNGGKSVDSSWRDTVSLVSDNGCEVVLGEKVTTAYIAAGGLASCSASFVVPAIPEGKWFAKVNVNSYRDVFEGALGVNNALVGDRVLTVMAEAFDPSVAREGVIGGGTPSVIKLTFGADDENRMVKFDLPAGVKVTWGFGFMPQGASQSGSMTATDGGVMFRVPEGATDVYVVLESDKTATYEMTTESTKMVITGVTPSTLPSSGTTTLAITGAGFGETNDVVLATATDSIRVQSTAKDASGNLIATVDCSKLAENAVYKVLVSSHGKYAEWNHGIFVQLDKGEGVIDYKVYAPSFIRAGRETTVKIEYKNIGNIDVPLPVFVLTSDNAMQFKSIDDDIAWTKRLCVMGDIIKGDTLVKPGEVKTVLVKIKTLSSGKGKIVCSLLDETADLDLSTYVSETELLAMKDCSNFKSWGDLCNGVRAFMNSVNLSCENSISFANVMYKYLNFRNGKSIVAGFTLDDNGLGVGSSLNLYQRSSSGTYFKIDDVKSWDNGFYCFSSLSNGEYCVKIKDFATIPSYMIVPENSIVINNLNYNRSDLRILLKDSVQNPDVNLFEYYVCNNEISEKVKGEVTKEGISFANIYSGTWSVNVLYGTYVITNFPIVVKSQSVEIPIELPKFKQISGVISDVQGNMITNTSIFSEGGVLVSNLEGGKFDIKVPNSFSWIRVVSPDFVSKEINLDGEIFETKNITLDTGVYVSGSLDGGILSNSFDVISFVSTDMQTRIDSLVIDGKYEVRLLSGVYDVMINGLQIMSSIEVPKCDQYQCDIGVPIKNKVKLLNSVQRNIDAGDLALYYAQLRLVCDAWCTSVLYSHAGCLLDRYLLGSGATYMCYECIGNYPDALKQDVQSKLAGYYYEDLESIGAIEFSGPHFKDWKFPNYWAIRSMSHGTLTTVREKRRIKETDEYVTLEVELNSIMRDWYDFYESRNDPDKDLGWKAYQLEKAGLAKPFWHIITAQDSLIVTMKHKKDEPKIKCNCPDFCACEQKCLDCKCKGDDVDTVISLDPNEMAGPLGLGDPNTERFVKPGEWMTYTVYFENMTNATAAAQEVYVTNPLSEWLDWSTFEMGEVSFGNQIDLGLSGKSLGTTEKRMDGTNWIVRTELSIEPDTTALDSNQQQKMCAKWYLRIVDPTTATGWPNDPVAGFLPPNNPETHCGEGHLTYRIKLRDDAPAGLVITNSATIVFDYNEPIATDPAWWNTVAKTVDVDCDGGLTLDDLVVGLPFGELSNPEPREGYIFEGWYTGKNGTGTRVTADTIVTAGMTSLYAHWTQVMHTVIVDGVATNVAHGTELMFTAPESFIDDTCTTQLVYVGTSFYLPTTNEFSIVVTNNIEFTWDILATNYWLNIDQPLHGVIKGVSNGWYLASTVVGLSTVADVGYSFNKWNGDISGCTELGAVLSVPMNKPRSIGASFVADSYTITYAGTKDIENTNPTSYTIEDEIVFVPLLDVDGWKFTGWQPASISHGSIGDVTVTAQWERIVHSVTVGGVTTNVTYGTEMTFVAPEPRVDETGTTQLVYIGSSFYQSITNWFTVVVTNNVDFTWDILATNYWLNIDQPLHGAITGATNGWYLASTVVDLSAVEDTGYSSNKWNGDISGCTELGAVLSVPMNKPRSIGASFDAEGYTITYSNTKDAENLNPLSYTIEDVIVFVPLSDVDGWKFTGWQPASISRGSTGNITVIAQWSEIKPELGKDDYRVAGDKLDGTVPEKVASVYDGYLYLNNVVMGTIQAKVSKPKLNKKSGVSTAKTSVTIQITGEKKITLKGELDLNIGEFIATDKKSNRTLILKFGSNGISGTFGKYDIDGARNFFDSKDKSEKTTAEEILKPYLGAYSMICDGGILSVTIAKKGKVTIKGAINGAKVSHKAQALIGEKMICIPVIYSKKSVNLAFTIWLPINGGNAEIIGLDGDPVIGKAGTLKNGAKFIIDGDIGDFIETEDPRTLELLPDNETITVSKSKWLVADGIKPAKVAYKKGGFTITEGKKGAGIVNPSGLKLTYKSKDGSFKGSFTVYAIVKGKLKKHKATVEGILIGDTGHGTITIKKIGTWRVTIE